MYELFKKPIFLFFIFILFVIVLNIFVLPLLHTISLLAGFFTVYIFWFFIVLLLFITSKALSKLDDDKAEDV